ncbi:MAG: methyltransferase domain-containing protein [Gaiellaceae bacterium]
MNVPPETLEILRCQQTLEPLEAVPDGLYSRGARLFYPVRDGVVYMGYDAASHGFMQEIIEAERVHQATPEAVEPGLAFLEESAPDAFKLIRLARKHQRQEGVLRGLELGAGSGWVSWLFAEAGYEMWACELELNSLVLGLIHEHARFGGGRRIACDATYAPFVDGAFDLVLCKEFAHHVGDKRRLFQEANRVLKPGGLLLTLDPVRSIRAVWSYRRSRDTIPEHAITWMHEYLSAVRASGFETIVAGALNVRPSRRVPGSTWAARRARKAMQGAGVADDALSLGYLQVVGGDVVIVAAKAREAERVPRPRIRVLDPEALQVSDADQKSFRPLSDLLQERARLAHEGGAPASSKPPS